MTPPAMAKRSAFFFKALAIENFLNGGDLLDLATVLVRLGAAMFHNTHNTAAEPILVRVLAIRMEILGATRTQQRFSI